MRKPALAAAAAAVAALLTSPCHAGPSGYRVLDRIPAPDGPWDFLRVDEANNRLLVTRGVSVMALDLATRRVTSGLAPGQRLHDALPLRSGDLLVTHGGSDTAVIADEKTGATLASLPTGKNPDAAAYDAATGLALVMAHAGGQVLLVDPRARKAVASIEVGGALEMAATNGAGRAFVNVEDRNEIAVLDLKARKVVRRYPLPGCDGPTGLAYDYAHDWLIAACDGSTSVVRADTGAVVANLKSGQEADGIALDAKRRLAFVPGREGSLTIISLAGPKPTIVEVLATEPGTKTLALDPRTGRVYLPTARFTPGAAGARPTAIPGSFHVLVVGK